MATPVKATMKWDEWQMAPYAMVEGGTMLLKGNVTNHYVGDLEATGTLECVVAADSEGGSRLLGFERIVGAVSGREGTFVLQLEGALKAGVGEVTVHVVEGSGTGALAGISGEGSYRTEDAGPDGHADLTLHLGS